MLTLTTHFNMPKHRVSAQQERICVIALGQKTGTKAKPTKTGTAMKGTATKGTRPTSDDVEVSVVVPHAPL